MHAHFAAMSRSPTGHHPHVPCACPAPHLCTCFTSAGDTQHCICECTNTYSLTNQQLNSAIQRRLRAYSNKLRDMTHFICSQSDEIIELTDTVDQLKQAAISHESQLEEANKQIADMARCWTGMAEALTTLHTAGERIFSSKAERP
jgi:flagellar biosynthesis chaperone FliJ